MATQEVGEFSPALVETCSGRRNVAGRERPRDPAWTGGLSQGTGEGVRGSVGVSIDPRTAPRAGLKVLLPFPWVTETAHFRLPCPLLLRSHFIRGAHVMSLEFQVHPWLDLVSEVTLGVTAVL